MSDDREARILGAGKQIEVGDKKYTLRPIVARHLAELEREALDFYKRQYLRTFARNLDLLDGERNGLMRETMMEVARWGLNELPQITVYDISNVSLGQQEGDVFTPIQKLKDWALKEYSDTPAKDVSDMLKTERTLRAVLSSELDSETLKPKKFEELTGQYPKVGKIRYDQWWVTACMQGMISFTAISVKYEHSEVTEDEVSRWPIPKITEGAQIVQSVTSAALGNM